ncbi:hypothetical protein E2562_021628 [Oryza meyeriana var. granulata]|uniref:RNase III domain-containing protein n=1 Tax=Oryza meyeriana var. granulata TaxID=110450 RepID=A0A6G1E1U0_9ORYZ|nr:hypothetical protein E2562_021628 [Oryza meyeriana var. granulata]KAF0917906.1 hypothetical protein E2562_021628 [Oryza meyeriana var. granulata]
MQQQHDHPPGAGFVEDRAAAAARVEQLLGYSFRDPALLEDALTHSVLCPRDAAAAAAVRLKYERLEFLGDAALGLAFSTLFYLEDPSLDEGELSLLRDANVSTQKLGRVAVRHELYQLLRRDNCAPLDQDVSRFFVSVRGPYSGDPIEAPKVLADIVETIIGAVYLDSKFDLELIQKVAKLLCEPIITKKALLEDPEPMLNELRGKHRVDLERSILGWRKVANVVTNGELVGNAAQDAVNNLMVGGREQASTAGVGMQDEVGELRTIRLEEA